MTYKTTGLTHLIKATGYSIQGLKSAVRNEAAFRHELFVGIFALPLAFLLGDDKFEIAFMIGAYLLVLIAELLNSSIECAIDRIGLDRHELSGRAKDQGSAAVFIAMVNCVIIWGLMIVF